MDDDSANQRPLPTSYDAKFDTGLTKEKVISVKVHLVHSNETGLPIGFTLRHGINTVFTVQCEQIPLVQVY